MLRKIFSAAVLAAAIFLAGSAYAATSVEVRQAAVILEPPVESFNQPEKVRAAVQQTVDKIFKNAVSLSVQSIDETAGAVQIYREENNLEGAETFLKRPDLEKICKDLGSDFLIYLRTSSSEVKSSDPISSKVNVVLDFRVWASAEQKFTYSKRVTMTGTGYGYGAEFDALVEGLRKCLQEVDKDAAKVRAAM